MFETYSAPDRSARSKVILTCGSFSYEVLPVWAQLPDGLGKSEITAVGCDSNDRVYVRTRNFELPIMVFQPDGKFLHAIAKGVFYERPHGIYINSSDELYCTDDKAHTAAKLTTEGICLAAYGTPNNASDTGCNRNVYMEDRKKRGIPDNEPIDAGKRLQMQLDTIVRAAPPFNGPTRMIEVPDGDLWCADGYGNAAIHHFDSEGKYISSFGSPGREPGQFRLPHGLLMDKKGNLWVADRENNRLQIFDQKGTLLFIVDKMLHPTELCTDGKYIYVSESGGGFSIFDQEAHIVAQFGYANSPLYLHGIGINSRGDLFGATLSKNKVTNIIKFAKLWQED